ncbi:hypothetical protein [Paenibacillus methanolicus]|uniref:DUF2178 domain-containing protein n=1 Tax=Paenibacillus methanolicus TaxID=582686 RepID=A0A5S5C7K0_9BACL|nr:hypothetical protein [Paenibacillus methanolicus]TYP75385.1 hypothetical protein BCM02_10461 [Paenibacillus methanolicus]
MKKPISPYFLTVAGVALFVVGLYFIKTMEDPQGLLRALPYICVGIGSGMFGHGMGELLLLYAKKNAPAAAKQLEIDQKDERNLAIANRAKAKAYDMMIFVLGALITAMALMAVDLTMVVLLACAYLFIVGYGTYYRFKYNNEM